MLKEHIRTRERFLKLNQIYRKEEPETCWGSLKIHFPRSNGGRGSKTAGLCDKRFGGQDQCKARDQIVLCWGRRHPLRSNWHFGDWKLSKLVSSKWQYTITTGNVLIRFILSSFEKRLVIFKIVNFVIYEMNTLV